MLHNCGCETRSIPLKAGKDIAVQFPGLYLVHQNLPGKTVTRHHHPEHLFFLPLQGEISVRLDARSLGCGPGKVIYLPPLTEHSFTSSSLLGERLICLISDDAWKNAGAAMLRPSVAPANQLGKELLFYLLLHPKTKNAPALVDIFIRTLSEGLCATSHSLPTEHLEIAARDKRLQVALRFLETNLAEKFSMRRAAKASGLSLRNFNRLFATEMGLTPKQVLAQYRIAKAKSLLSSSGESVTEISMTVGYHSLSQFITVFRQLTGQLPSDVRMGRG